MIRRATAHTLSLVGLILACLGLGAFALPAGAWAKGRVSGGAAPGSTGGSSAGGGGSAGGGTSGNTSEPAAAQPVAGVQTASAFGITLEAKAAGMLRQPMRFTGNVGPRDAGKVVEVERQGRQTGEAWMPTTHATVAPDGSFSAVWPTNHIGRFAIRVVIASGPVAHVASASSASHSPTLTITVYRPALATLYGPGFYGKRTACGEILRRTTLGVANRTLKCGTKVSIIYGGQTIVVPVIDRGPYAHGADWDLTMATARALGMTGTETIGAVSLPSGF